MRYDTLIIGAGMSGLAAGIRLAQFGRRVAILERHYLWGGLNSFYKRAGRRFDTGLHALTNYVPPRTSGAPLTRILRQLRIPYDALALAPQGFSESAFRVGGDLPRLRFGNDFELMRSEVARLFPSETARFDGLVRALPGYDDVAASDGSTSARATLEQLIVDPLLREMLLLPLCYYGSPREHDLTWTEFGVLFRSIFLEGLARPEGGVKHLLDLLVARYRGLGGELRMRCGVRRILITDGRAHGVVLDDGTQLECEQILSCAGWPETLGLCADAAPRGLAASVGRLSFVESISVLDREPASLGIDSTITFFNDGEHFEYARPAGPADLRSGVICCPNNYASATPLREGLLRVTVLANHERWAALDEQAYRAEKQAVFGSVVDAAERFVPSVRAHTVYSDTFTPRTVEHFTGHRGGAVYGSPDKRGDASTGVLGLYLCGTDQGLVGIVGALLSGITVANKYALVAQ